MMKKKAQKKDTKPYDTAFKELAKREPEVLLRLVGAFPPDATVELLPREISAPMLAVDQPYEVTSPSEHFIAHFEEQTVWKADVPARVVEYKTLFWLNHHLPVRSYVFVLSPRGMPADAPTTWTIEAHELTLTGSFTIVRVWELPAAEALATGSAHFVALHSADGGRTSRTGAVGTGVGQSATTAAAECLGRVFHSGWRPALQSGRLIRFAREVGYDSNSSFERVKRLSIYS